MTRTLLGGFGPGSFHRVGPAVVDQVASRHETEMSEGFLIMTL